MRRVLGYSHRRLAVVLLGVLLVGATGAATAYAQIGGSANIAGVVTDESGGALPGVTVTITNTATGRPQSLITGEDGRYRAVALVPGPYEVSAELQGFGTLKRVITLVVGAEAELDLKLGVANLAETITVVGETPLVEVAKSQPSSVITSAQLAAMPSLSRNFLVLAQLMPGAAPISRTPSTLPRNGVTKFGAVPDERYAYTTQIDGGDVDDAIWGNPTINLGQDAIAEFKVYRNQFDAQYGKATTAVVSVVTKSGTNRTSGSGYYFGRDKALNATNAFATAQPPFNQSRVGYSLGGPLVLNRTHYFSAYEGLFTNTASIVSLPASNPFATLENGTYPSRVRRRNFDARVDHHFNNTHNLYVRYAYDYYGSFAPVKPLRVLDGGLLTLGTNDFDDFSRSHSIVAEENWILSPTTVNTVRAHVLIHDLIAPASFLGPQVARPSFTWGQATFSPQEFPRKRLTLTDALLITRGKHDLNIGGEFAHGKYGYDSHQQEHGAWNFQTDALFDRTNPATFPFQFTIRDAGWFYHYGSQISAYVSDTYRVWPRWTLNLGLRWDFDTDLRDNGVIDTMLADARFKGMDQFVHTGKERGNEYDAFQPRLGATWDIKGDGTLVARGGYGVYITRHREWFSVSTQQGNFGNSLIVADRNKMGQCYPSISCLLDGKSVGDFLATSGSGLRTLTLFDDNYRFPEQRTATAGVGWQLTRTTGLDMDVVHSYMPNALGGVDVNLPASGPITAANPRPVPTLGRVVIQAAPVTRSWYDALEMQLRQRVRGANSLQVSYTLSRALVDGCTGVCNAGLRTSYARESLALLDSTGRSFDYGYNPIDTRHNLAIAASFALPLGTQVSTIARVISGEPVSATAGLDFDGDGVNDRPKGLTPTVGRGDTQKQLEVINAYRATLNLAPFTKDQISVKPPAKSLDVRLTKRLNLTPGRQIELFAEAFNVVNFVNTTGGGTNIRLATFNVPTGAQDARQVQWGARFTF